MANQDANGNVHQLTSDHRERSKRELPNTVQPTLHTAGDIADRDLDGVARGWSTLEHHGADRFDRELLGNSRWQVHHQCDRPS